REERAEILAKNNEERVKENLRKARIEKLTQEEIQQQQATAAARNSTYSQGETTDQQIPLDDTFNEASKQIDNVDKHATDKQPSKLTVDNQSSGLNQDEPNIHDTPLKQEQEVHCYSEIVQQS